jgi:hypothetical protein
MIQRIYHRWEEWEDYPAGFFNEHPPIGMTFDDCQKKYAEFLRDIPLFRKSAYRVIEEWPNSTEHNLTNPNMNRIAWIGQASVCIHYGIPAKFRGGYHLLTPEEQLQADLTALEVINYWMFFRGYASYTLETIKSRTEADLY